MHCIALDTQSHHPYRSAAAEPVSCSIPSIPPNQGTSMFIVKISNLPNFLSDYEGNKPHFRVKNRSFYKIGCRVAPGVSPSLSCHGFCFPIPCSDVDFLERERAPSCLSVYNFMKIKKLWPLQDYHLDLFCGDSSVFLCSYIFEIEVFVHLISLILVWPSFGRVWVSLTSQSCYIPVG